MTSAHDANLTLGDVMAVLAEMLPPGMEIVIRPMYKSAEARKRRLGAERARRYRERQRQRAGLAQPTQDMEPNTRTEPC
jgi:hypothetical protein